MIAAIAIVGCGVLTDAATRLAFEIEAAVRRLGSEDGASYTVRHVVERKPGEPHGPSTVQLDKVGALIVWCRDAEDKVLSSHSTTHHGRFVDTRETFIVNKPAGGVLIIRLERQQGRAVIVSVL